MSEHFLAHEQLHVYPKSVAFARAQLIQEHFAEIEDKLDAGGGR